MKRPSTYLLMSTIFAIVIGCTATGTVVPHDERGIQRAAQLEICSHFADADPGAGEETFESFLADSCEVAVAQLDTKASLPIKNSAADYLRRLEQLKDAEFELISRRSTSSATANIAPTQTGRFLMARHLKVLDAYGFWSDLAQANYQVAS